MELFIQRERVAVFKRDLNHCKRNGAFVHIDYYAEEGDLERQNIKFQQYRWYISPAVAPHTIIASDNYFGCSGFLFATKNSVILTHQSPSTFRNPLTQRIFMDTLKEDLDKLQGGVALLFGSYTDYLLKDSDFKQGLFEILCMIQSMGFKIIQFRPKDKKRTATHILYKGNFKVSLYQN